MNENGCYQRHFVILNYNVSQVLQEMSANSENVSDPSSAV